MSSRYVSKTWKRLRKKEEKMRLEQEESTSQIVCPFKNVFPKISKDFIHVYVNSQNGILYLPHFKVHEMLWGGEHFN